MIEHKVTLPLPPSVNATLVPVRLGNKVRFVSSKIAKTFRNASQLQMKATKFNPMLSGNVALRVDFFVPDSRSDVSNRLKALEDAMIGFAYADDKQIVHVEINKHIDRRNQRAEVTLWQAIT